MKRWIRLGTFLASAACALLLLASPRAARAGDGTVNGATADISVYFSYDETDANLAVDGPWHTLFKEASRLLWNATEGQLRFGKIVAYKNCPESLDRADFVVMNDTSGARANVRGIGQRNRHLWISQTHKSTTGAARGQLGCVHEWGHYHFGLYDEYLGEKWNGAGTARVAANVKNQYTRCVLDAASSKCCIMDAGTTIPTKNERTEFCTRASDGFAGTSHTPGAAAGGFNYYNQQDLEHGVSCWETIAAIAGLAQPTAEPSGALPAGHVDPTWEVITGKKRVVVCIDRSGSMDTENRIGSARSGASLFTYFTQLHRTVQSGDGPVEIAGDDLGVTAFDDGTYVYYPLQEMVTAADQTAARAAIAGITTGGTTSIGGGLRVSLNEILRFDQRVSGEAILLLSDGQQNAGEAPASVIPDLVARKVKVFTIALGSDADQALLQSVAVATGGDYFFSADPFSLASIFLQLQARTSGGALVFEAAEQTIAPDDTQSRTVDVSALDEEASFVFSSMEPGLVFQLFRPNGTAVAPDDPGVEHFIALGTQSYRIADPVPGEWSARVTAPPSASQGEFSASPGAAITDFGTTTSTITVPGAFDVSGVSVDLGVRHTYTGDLTVTLRSPAGTTVVLHERSGGGNDDIVGNYPLTLVPAEPLSAFTGVPAQGDWVLSVYDGAGGDNGTFDSWGLRFYSGIAGPATYQLQAYSTGGTIQVTAGAQATDLAFPEPAMLEATVIAGHAVAGCEVTANVETPDGVVVSVPMFDDGLAAHGDAEADDGTYSAPFSGYTASGTYRAVVDVVNEHGYAAPGVTDAGENDPDRPAVEPIPPFVRAVTTEFRVSGVPPTRRHVLRVDSVKLVQGKGKRDQLVVAGKLNAARGRIDPAQDDIAVTIGSLRTTFPKGTLRKKGKRDLWTFKDATRSFALSLYRGGGSLGSWSLRLTGADLEPPAIDPSAPVTVRFEAGTFDETLAVTMKPNPRPGSGGGFKLGPTNVLPAQLLVDVFSAKLNLRKPQRDKLVLSLRFPGNAFDPASNAFHAGVAGIAVDVAAGGFGAGRKGVHVVTVPVGSGKVTVTLNTNLKTVRLSGSKLDLSAISTPLFVDATFGGTTYRIEITPSVKGTTYSY